MLSSKLTAARLVALAIRRGEDFELRRFNMLSAVPLAHARRRNVVSVVMFDNVGSAQWQMNQCLVVALNPPDCICNTHHKDVDRTGYLPKFLDWAEQAGPGTGQHRQDSTDTCPGTGMGTSSRPRRRRFPNAMSFWTARVIINYLPTRYWHYTWCLHFPPLTPTLSSHFHSYQPFALICASWERLSLLSDPERSKTPSRWGRRR